MLAAVENESLAAGQTQTAERMRALGEAEATMLVSDFGLPQAAVEEESES